METSSGVDVARVIRAYAATARTALAADESPAVSYAGLWLLLASLAPVVVEPAEFRDVFGLDPREAKSAADRLLAEPHPAVAAAVGAWLRDGIVLSGPLPVTLQPLSGQAALDHWAQCQTRGLVETFPLNLDVDTMLVLASALLVTPRWSSHVRYDDERDTLVLDGGLQSVAQTSMGPVAVARPMTEDGIDVISVIAAPNVPSAQVWTAVDEVLDLLDEGGLANNTFPATMSDNEIQDGHSWTLTDVIREFWGDIPEEGAQVWETELPAWAVTTTQDLVGAPGVELVTDPIRARLPVDAEARCPQRLTATYDDEGFSAAAVSAVGFIATGVPRREICTVRQVRVIFDRPHAVIAIARGGAWDGVPLVQAWVDPKESIRYE